MKKLISIILILSTLLSCFVFTVSAEEKVISDEGRLPFEDVKDSHWFAEAVKFCYANNVINGMNEYTFGWNGNLTRAQFLTMLATIDGADLTQYSVTKFEDVKSNHWYYGAVAWAYETELTSGLTETKFGPNQAITRAQIARFMWVYMENKYAVEVDDNCLEQFADVSKVPMWAQDGMMYVVSAGLISGMQKNDKLFVAPNDMTTRAQTAVIFKNATEKYFCGNCEHVFSEADCTNAAVCTACGLANGLPNGHRLTVYNCITGGKCTVCQAQVASSTQLHNFGIANCGRPKICAWCGITRGAPTGQHNWWAATCTNPKMCKVCYKTEGTSLGHTTRNGICSRCKKENFVSEFNRVAYYMVKKASPDGNGNYALFSSHRDGNNVVVSNAVLYDANNADFTFLLEFADIHSGMLRYLVISIPELSSSYEYSVMEVSADGDITGIGLGHFDPAKASRSSVGIKWEILDISDSFKSFLDTWEAMVIYNSNSMIKEICDSGIGAFGFNGNIW